MKVLYILAGYMVVYFLLMVTALVGIAFFHWPHGVIQSAGIVGNGFLAGFIFWFHRPGPLPTYLQLAAVLNILVVIMDVTILIFM